LQTEILQRKNFHAPQRTRCKMMKFKKSHTERIKILKKPASKDDEI
jgi:hypothetical protein